MSGTRGYFKNGVWIEEPVEGEAATEEETSQGGEEAPDVDELIGEAKESVKKAVNNVVFLGKNLFGTEQGRKHLEKEARKAGEKLEDAIEDAVQTAKKEFEKAKEKTKK
ncbi:hypothetical protein AZH53_08855 [Methanomicrobiaceae archaeon CYW5]|uniref:hypothetical protein n=1 Tax=Methanovulcanius yangii TaxID=1789227 RepID=UPI0029CA262D|nr:hypothetical protein [Methanovulcanius yangii]MBT8508514.1 hypothetical protein [Methanovulcanius yangii]